MSTKSTKQTRHKHSKTRHQSRGFGHRPVTWVEAVGLHPEAEEALLEVLADDRNWFRQNPDQVVRLRPVMPGEEVAQEALGMTMPVLAPPGYCWSDAGSWVGVVHVQRASGDPCRDGSGGRLRFRIPPVPPCARQWMAEALVAYADHVIEEINDGRRPMVGIHAPAEAGI